MDQKEAWEIQYHRKGMMWRGTPTLHFSISKGEKILELGCGSGKTSLVLHRSGADVYCIDFSRYGLIECIMAHQKDIKTIMGDVLQMPFIGDHFDVVNCSHILEHLDQAQRKVAAAEAIRVLRHGGRLEFQGFSTSDMRCGTGELVEESSYRRGDGIMYHYFTDDEVKGLFPQLQLNFLVHKTMKKRFYGEDKIRDAIQAEFVKP